VIGLAIVGSPYNVLLSTIGVNSRVHFCEISIPMALSTVARLMTGVLYMGCYYLEEIKDMAQKNNELHQ
jgi:hypothetical protein